MKKNEEYEEARVLDPKSLRFEWREGSPARLTIEGDRSVLDLRAACAFPLSDPDRFISLLDGKDKEVGLLRELSDVPPVDQEGIRLLLRERYFIPAVRRVVSVKESMGLTHWEVETDRGPTTFVLQRRDVKVAHLSPSRLLVTDMTGNRFEFVNWERMDPVSRRFVARLA